MPKVPQYQSNVQDAAMPTAAINANTTVQRPGMSAVLETAPMFHKIYQEQKKRADDVALTEADAKLAKLETDLLYDKDNGATFKKGKDAFEVPGLVSEGYNQGSKEIEDTLTNDDQKARFRQKQLERGVTIDRTIQRHVGAEILRHDNDTTLNYLKNEEDAAIANYKDPARVSLAVQRQREKLAEFGQRNGLGEEEIKQKTAEVESKTHAQVINRMLVNDEDMTAEQYFKANKDFIKGTDLDNVEKLLEVGTTRGKTQRFVDDAIKRGLSEPAALAEARKTEDPKLRDAMYERVKMEYGVRDSAEKKQLEDLHVNALNFIDKGGAKDYTKVPGWSKMSVGQRNSLEEYAKSKALGKDIVTDYNVYYDLKTMASVPEMQDKFISMNLMEKRNQLSNGDFEKMVDLQSKLRQGSGEGKKIADGFRSDNAVVEEAFESAGFKKTNTEKMNAFRRRVEQEQIVQQERLGRRLNNTELQEIADKQLQQIVTKERSFWMDDKKLMFELSDDEVKNIPYKQVPQTERLKIESALKKHGKPVNEKTVAEFYARKLLKDRSGK